MVKIVKMTEKDISGVYNVETNSFNKPWSLNSFRDELNNEIATYFIAIKENEVAGYIGMWAISGQCDITNIAVLPKYRRQGIGRKLINHLTAHCKSHALSPIFLEVRESNEAAKSLYSLMGFKIVGNRKKYYADTGEDAIIMSLEI